MDTLNPPFEVSSNFTSCYTFVTRDYGRGSQRRVMCNHGATYRYLVGETVDDGDETAVVGEGAT